MSPTAERELEELLTRFSGLLRATVASRCPPALGIAVEDVEQEARIRVWRALRSATGIAHPASYVYRAAASAALDAIRRATARRQDRRVEVSDENLAPAALAVAAAAEPEAQLDQRRLVARARQELGGLEPERRRAVGLHLRGFSPAEIGELAGWSEAKSRSLVYRGLAELRQRMHPGGGDERRE
ncbi:MAG: sigma-70 family RNA polymerase sigma factor [Holophagales bacterium]|nr:MAG: sigma-70 family RNA polymerase sigma factor [Holophagales bacterium]